MRTLTALAAALFIAATPSAAFADPPPFASTSGVCNPNGGTDYAVAAQQSHPSVIARLVASGPGRWDAYAQQFASWRFAGADTLWEDHGSVVAGGTLQGTLYCDEAISYTVHFFDVPLSPTSFSGTTSPLYSPDDPWGSHLFFRAPGTAQYVVDLTLSQGAVDLSGESRTQTFASSGRFDLGTVATGETELQIQARDGPQARWTVAISALPVAITGPSFNLSAARPGVVVTAQYALSGDTAVTARVLDPGGQVVRLLADRLGIPVGTHTLTWDGLNEDGRAVADGVFRLHLETADPSGYNGSAEGAVTIDGTGPSVIIRSTQRLSRKRAVAIGISDRLSGLRSATLRVDGRTVARLRRGQSSIIFRPRRGWRRGSHRLSVSATDRVGNRVTLNRRFFVR